MPSLVSPKRTSDRGPDTSTLVFPGEGTVSFNERAARRSAAGDPLIASRHPPHLVLSLRPHLEPVLLASCLWRARRVERVWSRILSSISPEATSASLGLPGFGGSFAAAISRIGLRRTSLDLSRVWDDMR